MEDFLQRYENYKQEREAEGQVAVKEKKEVTDAFLDRYSIYKQKKEGATFLEAAPALTWLDKATEPVRRIWGEIVRPLHKTGMTLDPNERVARDQNAYAEANKHATLAVNKALLSQAQELSNEYDVPVKDIWGQMQEDRDKLIADTTLKIMPDIKKNWGDYIQQEYGLLTREKVDARALKLGVSIGLAATVGPQMLAAVKTAPLTTAIKAGTTIGIYNAGRAILSRTLYPLVESKLKDKKFKDATAKRLGDLLPEEATYLAKEMVNYIEFFGLLAASGKLANKITPAIEAKVTKGFEKLTKDVITKFKLPRKMYINANKVKDVFRFRTGKQISDEELDMLKSADLSDKQWRMALSKGADIELPSERVVTLVDKPYWGKIKGFFGVKPYKEIRVFKGDVSVKSPVLALTKDISVRVPSVKGVKPKPKPTKQPLIQEAKGKSLEEFVRDNEDKLTGAVVQTKGDLEEIGFDEAVFDKAIESGMDAEKLIKFVQGTVGENKDVGVYGVTFGQNVRGLVNGKRKLSDPIKTKSQLTDIWKQAQIEPVTPTKPAPKGLLAEAKKYKSAEEFVEGQQKVYRGGQTIDDTKITEKGISVSKRKGTAYAFEQAGSRLQRLKGKPEGVIQELFISPEAKIVDVNDAPKKLVDALSKADKGSEFSIVKWAKNKGFDAIDFKETTGVSEIRIINPKVLKTKSQLTDIWKQANQATPEQPLIQEAKKYKSAEEFVEGQPKVYHGTLQKFKDFDPAFLGEATGAKSAKEGFFFATNKKVAEGYADEAGEIITKGKIKEAQNKIKELTGKNHVQVTSEYARGKDFPKEVVNQIDKIQEYQDSIQRASDDVFGDTKVVGDVKEVVLDMKNPLVYNADEQTMSQIGVTDIIKDAKTKGHDSVIVKDTYDPALAVGDKLTDVHIVFNKSQIKTKSQLTDIWKQAQGEKKPIKEPEKEEIQHMHSGIEWLPPVEPGKVKAIYEKVKAVFDIESPYKVKGFPKIGRRVKEYYGAIQLHLDRVKSEMGKLAVEKYTPDELSQLLFLSSNKAKFSALNPQEKVRYERGVKLVRKYLDDYKEITGEDFYRNVKRNLHNDNEIMQNTIERSKTPEYRQSYKSGEFKESPGDLRKRLTKKIESNKKLIKNISKFEFVPIARFWFNDQFFKLPSDKKTRILNDFFHERKTLDIEALAKTLIDAGVITKEDTQIHKVLADYASRAGKIMAIKRIKEAAIEEGMARLIIPKGEPTEMWVDPPNSFAQTFKGYKLYRPISEMLEYHLAQIPKSMKLGRIFGYTKGLRFANIFWLGFNDVIQGLVLGSTLPQNFFNINRWERAVNSMINKDEVYQGLMEYGGYSQPYVLPFGDWAKSIDDLVLGKTGNYAMANGTKAKADELLKDVLTRIKTIASSAKSKKLFAVKDIIDAIYLPIWNASWFGDRLIRTFSGHYLLDKGYTIEEAAAEIALFHGDYASAPPATRKLLNKIFFVPTFPIIMAKLQIKMVNESFKALSDSGISKLKGKKPRQWTKREKLYVRGLALLAAWMVTKDQIMTRLGFERETFSYRYSKKYMEDGKMKEVVVILPGPFNAPYRYAGRLFSWVADEDKWDSLVNRNKWSLHPLWANAINQLSNDAGGGNLIFDPDDDPIPQAYDRIMFSARDIIAVLRPFSKGASEQERVEAYKIIEEGFVDDFGKWATFLDDLLQLYSFAYTREFTRKEAKAFEIKSAIKKFKIRAKKWDKEGIPTERREIRIRNFRERLEKLVEEAEELDKSNR